MRTRARFFLATIAVGVVILGGASAFACSHESFFMMGSEEGETGSTVEVTGEAFVVNGRDPAASATVTLHWNAIDGPVLARVKPEPNGQIATTFTVPSAGAGQYVVVAMQRDAKGRDVYGPMARGVYRVVGNDQGGLIPLPGRGGDATDHTWWPTQALARDVGLLISALAISAAGARSISQRRRTTPGGVLGAVS